MQRATYGRLLDGREDALIGYSLEPLAISDPEVVRLSGAAMHTVAVPTGQPGDRVRGTVFDLTPAELAATDAYEIDYVRINVVLASGTRAFLYVARER